MTRLFTFLMLLLSVPCWSSSLIITGSIGGNPGEVIEAGQLLQCIAYNSPEAEIYGSGECEDATESPIFRIKVVPDGLPSNVTIKSITVTLSTTADFTLTNEIVSTLTLRIGNETAYNFNYHSGFDRTGMSFGLCGVPTYMGQGRMGIFNQLH